MKTLIIMRFGGFTPLDVERHFFTVIADGESQPTAVGVPVNGGLLSVVRTKYSAEKVAQMYREISIKHSVSLPVIVVEAGAPGTGLFFADNPSVMKLLQMFKVNDVSTSDSVEESVVCKLTLDQLLDLVSQKGLKKLSEIELARLKELSGNK
jgi:hypothetical protein